MDASLKQRGWTAVSLFVIVPLGMGSKWYVGPAAKWVNNSISGVFYEILWCLLILLVLVRGRPWIIATAVFIVTSVLEIMQLSDHLWLRLIRSSSIGKALIGTTFTWSDFTYYLLGCGLALFWMRTIQRLNPCAR